MTGSCVLIGYCYCKYTTFSRFAVNCYISAMGFRIVINYAIYGMTH